VFGRTWARHGVQTLDGSRRVHREPEFYPGLSGHKNLQLLAGSTAAPAASRIDEVLETVDLRGRERDKVGGYSFGMRQRLGVAASLLRDPRLLCSTSPPTASTGRHPRHARPGQAPRRERPAVLLSSHDMGEIEEIATTSPSCAPVRSSITAHRRLTGPRPNRPTRSTPPTDDRAAQLATAAASR